MVHITPQPAQAKRHPAAASCQVRAGQRPKFCPTSVWPLSERWRPGIEIPSALFPTQRDAVRHAVATFFAPID